jgi:hypothetical protein
VLILKDRTNAQGQVEAGGRRCILGFTAIVGTDSREAPLPSSLSHIPPFPPHKGEFDKVNSTGCSCEPGLSSLRPFFVHTFPLSLIPPPPFLATSPGINGGTSCRVEKTLVRTELPL